MRQENTRYAVVIEEGENSFGAYVPDLPGCIAAAETREEVLELIQEAVEFHVEGLREDGQPIPEPSSSIRAASDSLTAICNTNCDVIEYVEIRAA